MTGFPMPAGPHTPSTPFATPEMAFVAAATAWPRDARTRGEVRQRASRVLDWDRMLRLVSCHHVAGLVASAVDDAGITLPAAARQALAEDAWTMAAGELRLAFMTGRLCALLEAADIPVQVLKGAATATQAFGGFGLRHSTDIDLLVHPRTIPAAAALLAREGFERTEPGAPLPGTDDAGPGMRNKDIVLWNPAVGITVELHWRLFQNPSILPDVFDAAPMPVELFPGTRIHALPQPLDALYLCLHGGEHGWARLKWLADIAALLRSGKADAATIYADARRRGLHRMAGPGLALAHRIYGTPLPIELAGALRRDWRMRKLVDVSMRCLAGDEDGRELEERPSATTIKNLSHYLVSSDPRHLWRELRYDLADRPADRAGEAGLARFARLARRGWGLIARSRPEGAQDAARALPR